MTPDKSKQVIKEILHKLQGTDLGDWQAINDAKSAIKEYYLGLVPKIFYAVCEDCKEKIITSPNPDICIECLDRREFHLGYNNAIREMREKLKVSQ